MTYPGLTTDEVRSRAAAGQVNNVRDTGSRSLASILAANIFTPFNALIGALWVAMILVAPWQDALFGFVIVANTLIGTIQEYRSARALAKLSVLNEARPVVVRDGREVDIGLRELVTDDLVLVSAGDQIAVDGVVLQAAGLEVDESLLTGEADPVAKDVGEDLMSGSFVVSGSAAYRVTRVGAESFAGRLTEQARQFQRTSSELRDSINRFIRYISFALVPIGALLTYSQLQADQTFKEAVRGAIAGVVTMVPEGLVLLTSIAMAVGALRLAQRQALVQDMPAVETLARVDIVCVDKTGTLTAPGMSVQEVVNLASTDPGPALAALAATEEHPNPTMLAIAREHTGGPAVQTSIPFSSARKWSAGRIGGDWYVIGAPDVIDPSVNTERWSATGARVLLLAVAQGPVSADAPLPSVSPQALVVIDQQLRSDAAQTVSYFLEQGVGLKVISGDNAATVGAIAARAGVPGAEHPVDARSQDPVEAVEQASVFGRVNPDQKQDMVDALRSDGHTVAMTGDGVNDVLALKRADLGIAMGSGSSATRAVAQIVLMDSKWSSLPAVVAEGRRILGNIERVSDVFLTKSMYALLISLATGLSALPFPFLPRHLTLISALTIGIPGFFLALMPNAERFRPGFFRRVMVFAVPSGFIAAATAFSAYYAALNLKDVDEARVDATVALFIVAVTVLAVSARPMNLIRAAIVGSMIGAFLLVLFIPALSELFALSLSPDRESAATLTIGGVGAALVLLTARIVSRWREPRTD
ncbi:MAG: HAD-IC family P-type ATPase [Candidatus Nanopelagicales bacterium]|nr:HAD-IC family P-type ATPase [Candidatus Nanopelagicales bacterium]MCU0298543.1 HAD-IC family P-type ATPase [Candidatus Nanopelagicales bacterium]